MLNDKGLGVLARRVTLTQGKRTFGVWISCDKCNRLMGYGRMVMRSLAAVKAWRSRGSSRHSRGDKVRDGR